MNKKNAHLTTELFTGKAVPAFVSGHAVFKNPTKVQKVFPAIGMPNYREKANLDKCLTDIKKEGTYVWNFLRTLSESFADCKNKLSLHADNFQYLLTRKEREEKRESMAELYALVGVIDELQKCSDPNRKEVIDEAVKTEDGRIVLRLIKDIPLPSVNGKIKMAHKKGEGLIKAYGKILLACQQYGVVGPVLEQTDAFKVFGKENIPNKEYSLVFSSDGPEGAWDILTMSMRGITSCQRWEGEYPKCLIGSMVSKFVGIMYLTSGVMNDGNDKNGNRANLGTKMMRRCIVRYAINADEDKPCIVLDKMYPDLDKDILKQFMDSIHNRTGFPVYYAPDPNSKLKHIYMPSEALNEDITGREMSYQDTPLKSKHDLYAIMLNFNRDEVERELKGFNVNLSIYMARKFEDIYGGGVNVVPEVKKIINNIRVNTSFTPLCDKIVATIVASHPRPQSSDFSHSRTYYRKYLMDLLSNRKSLMANCQANLNNIVSQNTSRTIESNSFVEYIFSILIEFTKNEIRRCVN
jgi:hypothetical protein